MAKNIIKMIQFNTCLEFVDFEKMFVQALDLLGLTAREGAIQV